MVDQFGDIQVFTGQELAERTKTPTSAVAVEQSRAVAEAQAAMLVARMNPRDEITAYERIMTACKRPSLAEAAEYAYKRGGSLVTGPTIRLAEVMARAWGNMAYGLRELGRASGASEMEAFAWDLETNTRVVRTFQVRHVREKRAGNETLTGERDIYELTANMGQRRVRACILEVIPGDIVEAAREQCKKTLSSGAGGPLEDRVRTMVVAFKEFGVSQEMIERLLAHPVKAMVEAEFVRLKQIFRSLKDGMAKREEFFSVVDAPPQAEPEKPKGKGKKEPTTPPLDLSGDIQPEDEGIDSTAIPKCLKGHITPTESTCDGCEEYPCSMAVDLGEPTT